MAHTNEKVPHTSEVHDRSALERAGEARREELRTNLEKVGEAPKERLKDVETARELVNEASVELLEKAHEDSAPAKPERQKLTFTRAERETNFKRTMVAIRKEMSPVEQTFSKIIHNKTVEAISEVAAVTVARPNAVLSGAVCAFILTLVVYSIARNYGYALSGFETIASFIIGWGAGAVFDFFKVMVTGKR